MPKTKAPKVPQNPAKIVIDFELLMDVIRTLLEEKVPFIFHHNKYSEAVSFSVTKFDHEAAARVAPEVFHGKCGKFGTTVYVYLSGAPDA